MSADNFFPKKLGYMLSLLAGNGSSLDPPKEIIPNIYNILFALPWWYINKINGNFLPHNGLLYRI